MRQEAEQEEPSKNGSWMEKQQSHRKNKIQVEWSVRLFPDTLGAISYVAFSYVTDDVNILSIDGVAPTDENVTTNDWKVWAYRTHVYGRGEPTALTAEFLEYILFRMKFKSTLLGDLGYIPISGMQS